MWHFRIVSYVVKIDTQTYRFSMRLCLLHTFIHVLITITTNKQGTKRICRKKGASTTFVLGSNKNKKALGAINGWCQAEKERLIEKKAGCSTQLAVLMWWPRCNDNFSNKYTFLVGSLWIMYTSSWSSNSSIPQSQNNHWISFKVWR